MSDDQDDLKEYRYPYYRMSTWFGPEDDIVYLFGWIENFRGKNVEHALAFGTGENTTKYALWVWGEEVIGPNWTRRSAPNSEPMGEVIYKFNREVSGEKTQQSV